MKNRYRQIQRNICVNHAECLLQKRTNHSKCFKNNQWIDEDIKYNETNAGII